MNFREQMSGAVVETVETTTKQTSSSASSGLAIGGISGKTKKQLLNKTNPTTAGSPPNMMLIA